MASGVPRWFADGFVSLFAELRRGIAATSTDTVAALTGRAPRPLAAFVRDHSALLAPAATAPATPGR
jgi:hypothetical protein